ncbi:hypothetical protein [Aeromonas schubertii]|uniref:Uncharacterized protein n=1 Tax=Aeromonas schubertii TaxID=652 RepID=A0A0S2SIW0_9GAMM|nr:hypothetical protein [Aeromonas schubertii]ALP41627.1 hypothetical protein WL1483_2208 [Aeromonas schubertii]
MRLMVGLWLLLVSSLLGAAEPRGEMTGQERERTLILLNEPVVMFQASLGSLTPEARVRRAKGRIATLEESDLQVPVEVESLQRFGQSVRFITLNGKRLVMLVEKDLDEFGVQIMSPNFVAQPPQNLVVPKAQWYAAPAPAEDNKR